MAAQGEWTTGICGWSEDWSVCCLTSWCPCVALGRIAEIVTKGNTAEYRSKLRELYMLPANPCNDRLVRVCCMYCSLCQDYRELKNRGIDPSLGWQGALKPPVGPGEMRRD
ncbi:PLAC8 motif-containing protein [Tanacetum coccineum]